MESRAADLRAVLDAAGSERTVLCGDGVGGCLGAFFAATYPERAIALARYAAAARSAWAPDFPTGHTQQEQVAWQAALDQGWGTEEYATASPERSGARHGGRCRLGPVVRQAVPVWGLAR
jgi:pimeloyl-ACP methyl ester carboxylesterase